MAHFVKIEDGIVTQGIVVANDDILDADGNESEAAGQAFIAGLGLEGDWKQTSYNTRAGKHPDEKPFRKNYAGIGYSWDAERDAFIPPKPFESWLLDEETCQWKPPKPMPETELNDYGQPVFLWDWDEQKLDWVRWDFPGEDEQ